MTYKLIMQRPPSVVPVLLLGIASALTAQTGPGQGVFSGIVTNEEREPLEGVEVAFPKLGIVTATNQWGGFRIVLDSGTHEVMLRRVGFVAAADTVVVIAGQTVQRRIVLTRLTILEETVVRAQRPDDPMMAEFEENRRRGFGYFITRDDLARRDQSRLPEVLQELPGLRVLRAWNGPAAWAGSAYRDSGQCVSEMEDADVFSLRRHRCACFAAVYIDRIMLYAGAGADNPPNINQFLATSLEAIEYYPRGTQTPLRVAGSRAYCGVLVLHTRRPDR